MDIDQVKKEGESILRVGLACAKAPWQEHAAVEATKM